MSNEKLDDLEYRALLDILMCADPWPAGETAHAALLSLAKSEGEYRGYTDWIDAYHRHTTE